MECPKCNSTDTQTWHIDEVLVCHTCKYQWTKGQQAEIFALKTNLETVEAQNDYSEKEVLRLKEWLGRAEKVIGSIELRGRRIWSDELDLIAEYRKEFPKERE
jgi:hypothetical protein